MECEKFYDKVMKDRNLLHKITSSEKYSWYDPGEIQSSTPTQIFVWVLSLKNNGKLNKTFFIGLFFHEYRILHNPRPVVAIPMSRFCLKEIWSAYSLTNCFNQPTAVPVAALLYSP
jgi:hypothetical protein